MPPDALAPILARAVARRASVDDVAVLARKPPRWLRNLFSCFTRVPEPEAVIPPAGSSIKNHSLLQGQSKVGRIGDRALNANTTSCGLVMGYTDGEKVALFHWPFMTNSEAHHDTFDNVVRQTGARLRLIQIVTNERRDHVGEYVATATSLRKRHGVPTEYYWIVGAHDDDPFVRLTESGFEAINQKVEAVALGDVTGVRT